MNIADIVVVKLLPGGFFIEIAAGDDGLTLELLKSYVVGLQIPGLQIEALEQAYSAPRGQSCMIAPLPGANIQTVAPQPCAPQVQRARIVRWQKPCLRPNTPIKKACSVFIIDMLSNMVRTFETAFAGQGIEVLHANLPSIYFSTIASKVPDLILLSSQLGKVDGCLLAARIRCDVRTALVPTIMYSGVRPRSEIVRAFDSGITDYLLMPVNAQTYKAKINNSLIQVGKCIGSPPLVATEPKKPATGSRISDPETVSVKTEVAVAPKISDLLRKIKDIMAVPHILNKVLKLAEDDNSSAQQLAKTIETDAATVATVLRKANTVFYGKSQAISDVKEAVVRIGMNEVKALVLSLNAIKMFSKEQKSNGFSRLDFWKHTMATGIIAKILGQQMKIPSPDDLFVGGLLHDIGKIILDEYAVPPFDDIVLKAINNRTPLLFEEKNGLGYTHVEVGAAVFEAWKFPDYLQVIVERHHHPETLKKETCKTQHLIMARLVYVANLLTKALGIGSGGDLSLEELPAAEWVQTIHNIRFEAEEVNRLNKELEEIGSLLEVGGSLCESVSYASEQLPEVILIDPLKKVRVLSIIKIHLTTMGYPLQYVSNAEEMVERSADKRYAICCFLEKYDAIQMFLSKLTWQLADWNFPLVIILPQSEKNYQANNGLPERPPFLKDNQFLLYEPFDVKQLHDALEGRSAN